MKDAAVIKETGRIERVERRASREFSLGASALDRYIAKKRIADPDVSAILSNIYAILLLVLVHFLELGVHDLLFRLGTAARRTGG
jgi:hypothetical protein